MNVRINTKELQKILSITPASQNIMLVGKHGIGKSQILSDFYSSKGFKVVPLFLGQMSDPGDLIGLLHKNEKTGKTEFMPPYWFPLDDTPVVLFLDELNRARPEVLQTIMDLALNRTLAGRSLPKGSRIISAVNDGEEYQLTDLDPALVSRFNIYEFVPTVNEWLMWAEENELDERIINFISENQDYLDGKNSGNDEDSLEKSSDRRGWARVSEMIKGNDLSELLDKKIIAGIVGTKAANVFFECVKKNKFLSGKDVLLNDFSKTEKIIASYTTPELAVINDGIFRFLEKNAVKINSKQKTIAAKNLLSYFNFLTKTNAREAAAHFCNMFTGQDFPNALLFIIENSSELNKKVMDFVGEIK